MDPPPDNSPVPRWLHWWAVLTVCAALPLVLLGAEVTTKQVGMVDPQGFRAPWHLLTLRFRELGLGYVIEHSHRLAGFVVGTCSIVLAVGLLLAARGRARCLGLLALAAVSLHGVLDIFRVNLNALLGPNLALVHGCFAQVTFAVLVSVAVLTSRAWHRAPERSREWGALRRTSLLLAGMTYAQVVLGAVVRHLHGRSAQRLHVLSAFAVVAVAVWLLKGMWDRRANDRPLRRTAVLLAGLIALQVALGVEAWLGRFGSGNLPELLHSTPALDAVRSGHSVVGALLFASTVVLTLLLHRPAARPITRAAPAEPRPVLTGVPIGGVA